MSNRIKWYRGKKANRLRHIRRIIWQSREVIEISRMMNFLRTNSAARKVRDNLFFFCKAFHLSNSDLNIMKTHLQKLEIGRVIDVGANVGQFGTELRSIGFHGKIFSFEPNPISYSHLKEVADDDANWNVENVALGEFNGLTSLNIASNNGLSSSILVPNKTSMYKYHKVAFVNAIEGVQVKRLDDFSLEGETDILLKLDVQGYELAVLNGAKKALNSVRVVLVEVSTLEFYKNQSSAKDVIDFLHNAGFVFLDVSGVIRKQGLLLQCDMWFMRKKENDKG